MLVELKACIQMDSWIILDEVELYVCRSKGLHSNEFLDNLRWTLNSKHNGSQLLDPVREDRSVT